MGAFEVTTSTYKRSDYTLDPGEIVQITRVCTQVTCLENDGAFRVQFDGKSETDWEAGLSFKPVGGCTQITIRNTSGASNRIVLGLSSGDVSDNRLQFGGTMDVDNGAGVSFGDVVSALANVESEIAAFRAQSDFVDLSGYDFGSTQTAGDIVTAAANTAGIKVLFASIYSSTGGDGAKLLFNGYPILMAGEGNASKIENVILPSGGALNLPSGGSSVLATYALEVL